MGAEVEDLVERVAEGEGEGTVVVDCLEVVDERGCRDEERLKRARRGGKRGRTMAPLQRASLAIVQGRKEGGNAPSPESPYPARTPSYPTTPLRPAPAASNP